MRARPCCSFGLVRAAVPLLMLLLLLACHTRFLRPKPDAHRMYAHDQVVIHTARM
jgi:hypothetical protein